MKAAVLLPSALAIVIGAAAGALAQPAGKAAPAATRVAAASTQGASNLGAQLAQRGAPNVAACSSCHGANGEGNAAAGFPRIAGQSETYLVRQLEGYAKDTRQNPVMQPIAKAMNDAQRRAASAYYAGLGMTAAANAGGARPTAASAPPANAMQRGAQLAEVGDESKLVQACANCHGPGGIGQAPAYPYLAGQHASYLQAALGEWKSGARKTDPSGQMVLIAQSLSEADISAVAAFYGSRPSPRPLDTDLATHWHGSTAVVSGPTPSGGAGQQTQGVGVNQGAGTSGGDQGPGGAGSASGGGSQGSPSGNSQTGGGPAQPGQR